MISRPTLEDILHAWNREYGHGEPGERDTDMEHYASFGHSKPIIGTRADLFNAEWVKLSQGSKRDYRMAQCLRADVMAQRIDPVSVILERLKRLKINVDTREYNHHVELAKQYFCRVIEL